MEEGDVQAANDEDEDIYKDIGDFRYDRELTKLEESNKAYTEDIARLSKRVNELTERNEALESVNGILVMNISILLKTAKAELDRKQLVIDEIRKKLEALSKSHGKNDRIHTPRSGSFKTSADDVVSDQCKMSDAEEGEILGDDSEGKKSNPDEGRRDDSNSRDRGHHSSSHRKRHDSHERFRGRSNDSGSSRRKSRYPDENYSRHSSSSRNHHRTSPDGRGHSDKNRSDHKVMHSSRPSHSHNSRNRRTGTSPDGKEQQSRKSRERRRSITKIDYENLRKDGSTDCGRGEQSSKHDYLNDHKSRALRSCGTKKEKKEVENDGNSSVGKTSGMDEYCRRKSTDGNSQKKSECDSLARQSVLADLYDELPDSKTFTEIPKHTTEEKDGLLSKNNNEEGSLCDWPTGNDGNQLKTKDSQVAKAHRTLYSRRMEAKFHQQQVVGDGIIKKCLENSSEKLLDKGNSINEQEKLGQTDEVDTQVEKVTEVVEVIEKDCETENNKETPQMTKEEAMKADLIPESATGTASEQIQNSTEGNSDQSFGESLVKKLLQLQTTEQNVGIIEFSPLKNNYKLSKISPLKPVSKQHILEYYNLKPSSQQLTNIEPEVLDFSFPLPETPGKNFFNSFLSLNDTKECASNREENDGNDKCTENSKEEENTTAADTKSGGESGVDDLTLMKRSRTRKKNCKTAKISAISDEACSESKTVQISDEEIGQGKSYKTRYHMRTRSKAENDKTNPNETEDFDEKCGRSRNGTEEEGGVKRERRLTLSDEADLGLAPKRMKCEVPKTENETSIDVPVEGTVPDDITSFEVFRSVSDENLGNISALVQQGTRVEEKSGVDELPSWNGGDFTANKTASNEDETPEMEGEKVKPLLSSTGNSGDSSNFKVLRSYLMLSANDDTDDEDFGSDGNSTGSGEYSDSGASALVDLL